MVATYHDLLEQCSFESAALAVGFPLVDHTSSRRRINLRSSEGIMVEWSSMVEYCGEERKALINKLRPLFFGAAWRVLDLVIEHSLRKRQPTRKYWQIEEKETKAREAAGDYHPLSGDAAIWKRITMTYAATVQARHCLVHRAFAVTPQGDLTGLKDKNRLLVPDVTAGEQEAFCRLAQVVLWAGGRSGLEARDAENLRWLLDQLTAHHRMPALGGTKKSPVEVVAVNASQSGGIWAVDLRYVKEQVSKIMPTGTYVDIEIHFPGVGIPPLTGRLEDAPDERHCFLDPKAPPAWAQ